MVCGAIPVVPGPGRLLTHVGGSTVKEHEGNARKLKNDDTNIFWTYGAGCIPGDGVLLCVQRRTSTARKKSALCLLDDADLNDCPTIEAWVGAPRFRRTVCKQRTTAPASSLQTTSPAETGSGAICTDGFQGDRGQLEIYHG